jgi:hypothetical protein
MSRELRYIRVDSALMQCVGELTGHLIPQRAQVESSPR